MDASSTDFRTKLAKVRGLGAAHHGFGHWWLQRLTAVALVPLLCWFAYVLVHMVMQSDIENVRSWFASPWHAVLLVLMLGAMFFHAKLGLQVIIEDYVHTPVAKYTLLLANTFFCFGFAAVSIVAVLKLHLQIAL